MKLRNCRICGKKGVNYIKDREDKILKKYKDTFTKEIKNKKF